MKEDSTFIFKGEIKLNLLRKTIGIIAILVSNSFLNGSIKAQTYNEILGRPTNTSITISFLCEQKVDVYWEMGTTSNVYNTTTSTYLANANTPLEVDFTSLISNTKYYYRTRYRLNGTGSNFLVGQEHTFYTQRAIGSTFTFTIEADEHLYDKKGVKNEFLICLANQAKDKPDFMLSLGDTFGDDHNPTIITSQELDILHKNYRPYLGSICHSIPFYFCIGNHEGEKDYFLHQAPPNNMAVYATLWRKYYYPNPYPNDFYSGNLDIESYGMDKPENYYSWTWGDALFVVLDVYRYDCSTSPKPTNWNWTLGEAQYAWLKSTLEGSTSKYKFVFAHHVSGEGRGGIEQAKLFEWGGYEADGITPGFTNNRPGWAKPIHQLFVDNKVNIFFQGHDHLFAREEMDGVIYQEVPMPSDSTYEIGMLANADAYVSDTIGGSGHIRVTVSPSNIKVDFIRAYLPADTISGAHQNGEVAFSYTIEGSTTTGNNVDRGYSSMVNVFPNPAKEFVNVRLPSDSNLNSVSLFNSMGQLVKQTQSTQIDVRDLPYGFYLLNVKTERFEVNKKIIINKEL
jgi:hypothetical protein